MLEAYVHKVAYLEVWITHFLQTNKSGIQRYISYSDPQLNSSRILFKTTCNLFVLTTHRLAYLCCQCDASLDEKLARREVEQ